MTPQYFQHNSANFCEMENKESKSYIERIEIKGLWGRFDVNWKLHPDVNILVGENGTGKSTILEILAKCFWFNKISNDKNINLKPFLEADLFKEVSVKTFPNRYLSFILENGFIVNFERDKKTENREIKEHERVYITLIQTFENQVRHYRNNEILENEYLKTNLDIKLDKIINNYVDYQLNQTKKIINDKQNAETVFAMRKYLINTINSLFVKTKKRIDEDENRIAFLLENGKKLSPYKLSSGEKQLLIILLTVLCQDEKPSILLLDEPEISMHLTWQYELIEIIRTLNPNCQVIIVTHSPSIFTDGWNDRVFWIEDICKPSQKLEKV